MFKQLMFFVVFGSMMSIVAADTIPGGEVSGIWYADSSPYYIAGSITVPAGDTLLIEPGVVVDFLGYYTFTVAGWLEAVGTEADSICFTGGRGITFSNAPDTSHFAYCSIPDISPFDNAVTCTNSSPVLSHSWLSPPHAMDGVFINGSSNPRISDCVIGDSANNAGIDVMSPASATITGCLIGNTITGIWWGSTGSGTINSCLITGSHRGVHKTNGSLSFIDCTISDHTIADACGAGVYSITGPLSFTNCTITDNLANGLYATGGGIYSQNGNVSYVGCTFHYNRATGNGGGVFCGAGTATFTGCTFSANEAYNTTGFLGGGGIALNNANAVISYCTFYGNFADRGGGAIACSTSTLGIDHCTIDTNWSVDHGSGIQIWSGTGMGNVTNTIISNNYNLMGNGAIHNEGTLTVGYSDFHNNLNGNITGNVPTGFGVLDTVNYNGDSCDCYHDIFMDPMYADTVNNDYHLTAASPCIDAGDPASPYDPDSTIADMGCYFFDQRAPNIALSATSLDFGSVPVGQSADLPLVIYNLGDANLLVYDIYNNLAVFTNDWNPVDSVIMPNDSLEVIVAFTPDDTIAFNDTCWIDNNDSLCYVTLNGQGLSPGITEGLLAVPKAFALRQPLPNPCQSFAAIAFELPKASVVSLSVYDVSGRKVSQLINGLCDAGIHEAILEASDLSAGVYFFCFNATGFNAVRKLTIAK